jgi:hypothetical protein
MRGNHTHRRHFRGEREFLVGASKIIASLTQLGIRTTNPP